MCLGGSVIVFVLNDFEIVINGMSEYVRDKINVNSVFLVNVMLEDFKSDNLLVGVYF